MSVGDFSQSKSDEAVRSATGRSWADWFAALDSEQLGATPSHQAIVAAATSLGASAWWAQGIAVGFEQARGLRQPGQSQDGTFAVSVSKTVTGDHARVLDRIAETLELQFGPPVASSRAVKFPNIRFDATPGRLTVSTSPPKGEKVSVNLTWEKLPSGDELDARKAQLRELFRAAFDAAPDWS